MAPNTLNNTQLPLLQVLDLLLAVLGREVAVGPRRHHQHPRLDTRQRRRQVPLLPRAATTTTQRMRGTPSLVQQGNVPPLPRIHHAQQVMRMPPLAAPRRLEVRREGRVAQRLPGPRAKPRRAQRPGRVGPVKGPRAAPRRRRRLLLVVVMVVRALVAEIHGVDERRLGPLEKTPIVPRGARRAGEDDGALDKVRVEHGHVVGLLAPHGEANVGGEFPMVVVSRPAQQGLAEGVLQMDIVLVGDGGEALLGCCCRRRRRRDEVGGAGGFAATEKAYHDDKVAGEDGGVAMLVWGAQEGEGLVEKAAEARGHQDRRLVGGAKGLVGEGELAIVVWGVGGGGVEIGLWFCGEVFGCHF